MHTTNYYNTLIVVSPDSVAIEGREPTKPGSVAAMQFDRISAAPYQLTSDDVIFGVWAARKGIEATRQAREAFFAKGQACLRASPLVKTHGYGVHHDAEGRIALYGAETAPYHELVEDPSVQKVSGMRTSRGKA